jgi:hypothetical protein
MSTLQEWAVNHTYEELVKRNKDNFNVYTMFVAAHEFKTDSTSPPSDRDEQQKWKPKHRARIVLTCIAMSMFIPAIACRGDIFGRVIFSDDFTYKVFLARGFRLGGIYVYDATLSAKLIGYEVTCNESAGDVYVTARACRNVTEYICSLEKTELPGCIKQLPFNMPSPVPPFTKNTPLRFNPQERVYKQESNAIFMTTETARYCSKESKEAREEKVCAHLTFSPALVPSLGDGECATSFRMDLQGLEVHTGSDGDKAISIGLGAAFPSCTFNHMECYAHLRRLIDDVLAAKGRNKDKAPVYCERHFKGCNSTEQKTKRKAIQQLMYKAVISKLEKVKNCRSRQLGQATFEDLISCLRCNKVESEKTDGSTVVIHGKFEKLADYMEATFARQPANGSHGVWRLSDLLDGSLKAYDEQGNLTNKVLAKGDLQFGLPDNTNSLEARNNLTKAWLRRQSRQLVDQMLLLMKHGGEYAAREVVDIGVSFLPPVFGTPRIKSTRHTEDIRHGMVFLGYGPTYMDQRPYIKCSPSDRHGVLIYMLNGANMGKDDLLILETKWRDLDEKKAQVEHWRKKYNEIMKANSESLDNIIKQETLLFIPELSNNRFKPNDKLPANIVTTHPELYATARTETINELNEYEHTFVCLTPIHGNFEHIQLHEPWRSASTYTDDKNVVYKWRCDCQRGLRYGFCGHIFFLTHSNTDLSRYGLDSTYTNMEIPVACHSEDLSKKRKPGRPSRMEPALKRDRSDDEGDL